MTETIDLINALAGSKTSEANNVFKDIMNSKISAALDAQKIEIANDTYNGVTQDITDADISGSEIEPSVE